MEIPPTVVTHLIRLGGGEIDSSADQELATRLSPFDWVDRLTWQSWDMVTAQLPRDELASLARGLVRAEKIKRWGGGSVAGAIWVFRAFKRRFAQEADELAEWMLAHSSNPWVPFGSNRGSARSLEEIRQHEQWAAERRKLSAAGEARRALVKQASESVRRHQASHREQLQRAVSEARGVLIAELESLPLPQRLAHLAWDTRHPLEFYPVSLAAGAAELWTSLLPEVRETLLRRAAAVPRGPWRRWWREITESIPGGEIPIRSRDYWFKIVEFLQHSWALIDSREAGVRVWFLSDTSGVFDELDFPDPSSAAAALQRNGFARLDDSPQSATFLRKPPAPFVRCPHPAGRIYSSGQFWTGPPACEDAPQPSST